MATVEAAAGRAAADVPEHGPYVGPRPFERGDAGVFFGRDGEVRELLSLVVAHRVVLLYAASGAGKTSLLSAGLVPALEAEEQFEVLPIARIRGLTDDEDAPNVYAAGLISHWGVLEDGASIAEVLAARDRGVVDGFPAPRALLVDQLEELFTVHQERWRERAAFIEQLAEALRADPLLRIVLAIREDYVAQLDPYAATLGGLRTRFRLELLRPDAALAAVVRPLAGTGKSFAPGTAEKLIRDLLRVRVETGTGEPIDVEGEFVEPVQLQVACHSLWSALPPDVDEITDAHLETFGDVDEVLAAYYADAVAAAARAGGLRESRLRDRVEHVFITPLGTRGTAYGTQDATAGIPAPAIDELERRHVVRAERARGARWYELTHDRLIEPIRTSNRRFRQERDRRRRRRYGRTILALAILAVGGLAVAVSALRSEAEPRGNPRGVPTAASRSLVEILRGHRGPLTSVAISSDGKLVVTASSDGTAVVWEAANGQVLVSLRGDGRVTSAAFDPAVDRLVTTSADGTVRQWNWARIERWLEHPAELQDRQRELGLIADGDLGPQTLAAVRAEVSTRFTRPGPGILDAAYSPDGKLLAAADARSRVLVYSVANGARRATLQHTDNALRVAFSPDSRRVATAGREGNVRIWSLSTGKVVRGFKHPRIASVSYGRGGRLVTAGGDGTARVWSVRAGEVARITTGSPLTDAVLSADGLFVAVASTSGRGSLWDLRRTPPARASVLIGHTGAIRRIALDPAATFIATASADETARVWSPFGDLGIARPLPTRLDPRSEFDIAFPGGGIGIPAADGRRYHAAKDWPAPAGTEVRAPVGGRIDSGGRVGTGLRARDGKRWTFAGMRPSVAEGETVSAGDVIGTVVPQEPRPEIHIQVWKRANGKLVFENAVDPMIYLGQFAESEG